MYLGLTVLFNVDELGEMQPTLRDLVNVECTLVSKALVSLFFFASRGFAF
jgi:hypothetical protein